MMSQINIVLFCPAFAVQLGPNKGRLLKRSPAARNVTCEADPLFQFPGCLSRRWALERRQCALAVGRLSGAAALPERCDCGSHKGKVSEPLNGPRHRSHYKVWRCFGVGRASFFVQGHQSVVGCLQPLRFEERERETPCRFPQNLIKNNTMNLSSILPYLVQCLRKNCCEKIV